MHACYAANHVIYKCVGTLGEVLSGLTHSDVEVVVQAMAGGETISCNSLQVSFGCQTPSKPHKFGKAITVS